MTKKLNEREDSQKLAVKNSFCYTVRILGDMAELVDAADLKSADYYNLKGSSPFIPIENFFKKIQRSPPHQGNILSDAYRSVNGYKNNLILQEKS